MLCCITVRILVLTCKTGYLKRKQLIFQTENRLSTLDWYLSTSISALKIDKERKYEIMNKDFS